MATPKMFSKLLGSVNKLVRARSWYMWSTQCFYTFPASSLLLSTSLLRFWLFFFFLTSLILRKLVRIWHTEFQGKGSQLVWVGLLPLVGHVLIMVFLFNNTGSLMGFCVQFRGEGLKLTEASGNPQNDSPESQCCDWNCAADQLLSLSCSLSCHHLLGVLYWGLKLEPRAYKASMLLQSSVASLSHLQSCLSLCATSTCWGWQHKIAGFLG